MEWLNKINDAINYIEENLTEKIDYSKAAEIACYSLSRFQNMFLFVTDITPAEYVRRRRMVLSAAELVNGNAKVIDLALHFQYESAAAFTRSFTTFHRFSPTVARKFRKFTDYPPISFQLSIIGGHYTMDANSHMTVYKDILIKVETIELPETIKVACLVGRGFAFEEFEKDFKPQLIHRHTPYISTGFATNYFGEETYLVGCFVDSLESLPEGLEPMDIGVKRFAVFTFRSVSKEKLVGGEDGPGEGMEAAGQYIKEVWMPKHKVEVCDLTESGDFRITTSERDYVLGTFEVYKCDLDVEPEMCVYVPLK